MISSLLVISVCDLRGWDLAKASVCRICRPDEPQINRLFFYYLLWSQWNSTNKLCRQEIQTTAATTMKEAYIFIWYTKFSFDKRNRRLTLLHLSFQQFLMHMNTESSDPKEPRHEEMRHSAESFIEKYAFYMRQKINGISYISCHLLNSQCFDSFFVSFIFELPELFALHCSSSKPCVCIVSVW